MADHLLTEGGGQLLAEDGVSAVLAESDATASTTSDDLLSEDGWKLLAEDGSGLATEGSSTSVAAAMPSVFNVRLLDSTAPADEPEIGDIRIVGYS